MTHRTILSGKFARDRAKALIDKAPDGYVATVAEQRRTNAQNDKMWAMLTDISVAMPGGQRYTPDEWKPRIMQACGFECQFLPGILDGHPFPVGFKSSELSKSQMAALINWMQAWGDEQGIRWTDPDVKKDAA
jgi:hypothetical protein